MRSFGPKATQPISAQFLDDRFPFLEDRRRRYQQQNFVRTGNGNFSVRRRYLPPLVQDPQPRGVFDSVTVHTVGHGTGHEQVMRTDGFGLVTLRAVKHRIQGNLSGLIRRQSHHDGLIRGADKQVPDEFNPAL